jgi:hypothetical protein
MTFAFNLEDLFRDVLVRRDQTLKYSVFDKDRDAEGEDRIDPSARSSELRNQLPPADGG